ncbi:MAG TPA: bifunctional riboflavin kinase/FAD synthetase [Tenuifilaceae bacterium]|nr:bifunctional riboflavin kinase/FAD synthetase [Tenuifilaceae bacterium]HPE18341.1 bifunctional riboflavin kinase/FAD synthetase [Tenuifilaceae bacterium]HPJ45068.1 bifunctional riboflavin kinase/FAD synthetase [Tenuifilaceae bacterium]HPQ34508.1 bifunctional riboflavin kinase/FAD synthetase [Tenuifilaceae bacterium]HRX67516.1 bifunctional riboflavin kinase/FAD synthetase [Tenuifilaceae bacterium]
MKVFHNLNEVDVFNSVATIGFFDGVHIGHQQILAGVIKRAKEFNTSSLVITFWPHPRLVIGTQPDDLRLLSSQNEKIESFKNLGVDAVLFVEFTPQFAALSAADFVKTILAEKLKVKHMVVGYNNNFGSKGEGNFSLLQGFGHRYGFTSELINPVEVEGVSVSSSKIRAALERGNLDFANRFLGYCYPITGTIEGGKQIGRSIGFPTANISPSETHKQIPGFGVYAVWFDYDGKSYPAMLNIGVKPTVGSELDRTIEAHIIGFNQNIYAREVMVRFVKKIRDEMRFPSLEHLKNQLVDDKARVLSVLGITE